MHTCAYVAFHILGPSSGTAMVIAFSLVAMLLQQLLDASSCGNTCAFLVDLRSVACASRDMVTDAHWRHAAQFLWPGATTVLFGSPAFQVWAFLAKPSAIEDPLRWTVRLRCREACPLARAKPHGAHAPSRRIFVSSHCSASLLRSKPRYSTVSAWCMQWRWHSRHDLTMSGPCPFL